MPFLGIGKPFHLLGLSLKVGTHLMDADILLREDFLLSPFKSRREGVLVYILKLKPA
jgi:hypothetical protein